jgi:dimethylamine/trimethylamine dehydrogenase
MGGIMRWIPSLPGLGEWARVVNYRKIQIDKLRNVEFIPDTKLDAKGVAEYGAEIVIVATGAYWATDGLNGATHDTIPGADASLPHILTPEQIMVEGKMIPGSRVILVDNDGYFMGVSLAEKLALEGKQVTIMTPMGHIAPYMHFTLEAPNMHRKLHSLGVDIVTYHMPTKIEAGGVTAAHVYDTEGHERSWDADAVVLVTQRRSNEALFRELKDSIGLDGLRAEGIESLYRIGDCEAPRLVADAIFSGHRLAREIDTDNPAVPLPYKRERRVPDEAALEHDLEELRARREREAVPA